MMSQLYPTSDRIEADYIVETSVDPRRAVDVMAGEQSSGTFVPIPGETPELKERSAARVDVGHETVRFWWIRFRPMFAADIRKKRIQRLRAHSDRQWHLDKVFVKINGESGAVRGN